MANAKSKETEKALKDLPTILSFTRNIEPSDGLMYSGKWEDRQKDNDDIEIKPKTKSITIDIDGQEEDINFNVVANRQNKWKKIPLSERKNLGTKSQYNLTKGERIDPNPVESDKASLFDGDDSLKLSFSVKILGNVGEPTACNNPDFVDLLTQRVEFIKKQDGLKRLAFRYAYNIANARFLFRNRVNAEAIEVYVSHSSIEKPLKFNAYDFSRIDFDKNRKNEDLNTLAEIISRGLCRDMDAENGFEFLEITAYARMGNRSQVYPSQEMNIGEARKRLFQLEGCAGMHDVKLGNAIRTIDTWYPDESNKYENQPFAIEPFGAVVQKGFATREGNKSDLYTYLKNLPLKRDLEEIDNMDLFFMANLIRGGLFQGKSKK